jgi:hypothetical protein
MAMLTANAKGEGEAPHRSHQVSLRDVLGEYLQVCELVRELRCLGSDCQQNNGQEQFSIHHESSPSEGASPRTSLASTEKVRREQGIALVN